MTTASLAILVGFLASSSAAQDGRPLRHEFHLAPDDFRGADTRELAVKLVERLHRACESASDRSAARAVGDDAEVLMMVPQEAFDSIARHGFQNQHVTNMTRGDNRTSPRFLAEQELAMLRLPYSHKGRELLPKYALLNPLKGGFGAYRLPERYGAAAVVFKKEVLPRVTWTYADSLDFSRKAGLSPVDGRTNPVFPRTARYRRPSDEKNVCVNYCEAQVWGELDLSDVAYVMLPEGVPLSDALRRAGTPVYRFSVPAKTIPAAAQYLRGALLKAGAQPAPSDASAPSAAESAILDSIGIERLSDEELMKAARAEKSPDDEFAMSRRLRLVGELAVRAKSPEILSLLRESFQSRDGMERAVALHGLSELPPELFRPHLLEALGDPRPLVQAAAVALAAEQRGVPAVGSALESLSRRKLNPAVRQWLDRLEHGAVCP